MTTCNAVFRSSIATIFDYSEQFLCTCMFSWLQATAWWLSIEEYIACSYDQDGVKTTIKKKCTLQSNQEGRMTADGLIISNLFNMLTGS